MNKIERLDGNPKRRNSGHTGHWSAGSGRNGQQRHASRRSGFSWALAIAALAGSGLYVADRFEVSNRFVLAVTTPKPDTLRASFPFCTDERRITCVVDGDTFWLSGEKIRIADIDTLELSPPRCEAERATGEAAKRRLRELLNAGPFSLVAGFRDEDQYGRKLRTVTRDGRSSGNMLVQEGLARRRDGARRSWCD